MFTEAFPILTVSDLPAALRFYTGLLGFEESYRFPDQGEAQLVTVKLGHSELGLAAGTAEPAASFSLCVYTGDCDAAVGKLRAAGTPVLEEPSDQPWGERMARVTDPAGNEIVIVARL
jgi:uncharacterized glyoxalase superfamily protein PhnB